MKEISTVFLKQVKDTLGNKTVLIQFILFPVMAVIMQNAVNIPDMPENFFVKLFSVMYIGMAPLTAMSAVISEEKEKNTLRALKMSGVSGIQYLIGTGTYVFIMCMAGTAVFAASGGFTGTGLIRYFLIMSAGTIVSLILGGAVGISSANQMSAASVSVPVTMVLSFLPMLSNFNEKIKAAADYFYPQQISLLINGADADLKCIAVTTAEALIILVFFMISYRKRGLE
ncbi:MAG: ABC transporter permease [Ruminococcus sp.]|nr:ABC transporter permease [Ruminococcus sp.]